MRVFPIALLTFAATVPAVSASANWVGFGGSVGVPITSPFVTSTGFEAYSADATPTMRRQRHQQAVALRAEVDRMKAENGGVIPDNRVGYVRRKVERIFGRR